MRTIGGAFGAQIAAAIVAGHVNASGFPAESGFTTAFVLGAGALVLALAAGAAIPGRRAAAAGLAGRPSEARG